MLEADRKEFATIVSATLKTYRIEPDVDVLDLWWGALKIYSIQQVRNGFNRFIRDAKSDFLLPKAIVAAIQANEPDGRVGAEEAWAMYPHDEATSAVITNEMAEAMQIAQPLYSAGDKIAARKSFLEAYQRIVEQNKTNNLAPTWFASLGHDKAGREAALKDAVQKGRISQTHAAGLLPAPIPNVISSAINQLKLATTENTKLTDTEREKASKKMAAIKAMFQGGVA